MRKTILGLAVALIFTPAMGEHIENLDMSFSDARVNMFNVGPVSVSTGFGADGAQHGAIKAEGDGVWVVEGIPYHLPIPASHFENRVEVGNMTFEQCWIHAQQSTPLPAGT